MKNKLFLVLVLFLSLIPIPVLADSQETNDQELASELSKTEVDFSLASGWHDGNSRIFTTLYDENGKYRGYRTTEVFENGVPENLVSDYQSSGSKVCSVFEVNTVDVEYEGASRQAVDFICTQEVGNGNPATVEGDKLTINKGFGKTDGYLVGISVLNKTFDNVVGGEVKNNVVYVLDNNGGSADIVALDTKEEGEEENTEGSTSGFDFKKMLPVIAIGGGVLLVIIIIVVIVMMVKKRKKKQPTNNPFGPEAYPIQPPLDNQYQEPVAEGYYNNGYQEQQVAPVYEQQFVEQPFNNVEQPVASEQPVNYYNQVDQTNMYNQNGYPGQDMNQNMVNNQQPREYT